MSPLGCAASPCTCKSDDGAIDWKKSRSRNAGFFASDCTASSTLTPEPRLGSTPRLENQTSKGTAGILSKCDANFAIIDHSVGVGCEMWTTWSEASRISTMACAAMSIGTHETTCTNPLANEVAFQIVVKLTPSTSGMHPIYALEIKRAGTQSLTFQKPFVLIPLN